MATIKIPPHLTFVKQANIAHGHQQANNGQALPLVRAETENAQTELLGRYHERLDIGVPCAAGAGNPPLEAVDAIYRPAHGER